MKYSKGKKLFIILLLAMMTAAVFASDYYTGKGMEDKSFFMLEPAMMNVDVSERAWLPSAVSAPLKSSLKLFTGMTPVNFENTAKIQEIQKKVESGAYDGSRAVIEAGMLQDANYGVFVTVTKTGSTYQLAVSITNLTTGREEATSTISNIEKATDLQESAINASIVKLAPQLGVNLTTLGIYTLSNNTDGTLDDQILLAKQEAASYQATIDALNKELASLNTADALTNQDALSKKAAAETEKQLYEQRQQAAKVKAQRLLEQKQKADEEAMAATARSAEATKKLGQLSAEADTIAAAVRAKRAQNMSAEERITLIENKKAAYMQIYNQVNAEIESYWLQADNEYIAGYIDPDNPANYPAAFYQNGVMNQDYRQMLINTNTELRRQCNQEAETNIANAKAATDATLTALLADIRNDLKNLSKDTFTLSSLSNPEIFNISSYNVNSYSWNASINFSMFNDSCEVTSVNLSYENVTGEKKPDLTTPAAFEEYAATYDIYDAMFRMGTPFLTLELDYTIMPDDDDYPSSYIICPLEYRLLRTSDNKSLRFEKLHDENMSLQYYPITDMQGIGETVAVNEIRQEEKKQEAARQAEEAKKEAERKKAEQKELQYYLQPELGMGPGIWAAGTYSKGAATGIGGDAGAELKFPGFGMGIGCHTIPAVDDIIIGLDFGITFDKELKLLGKKNFFFYGLQVGPAFYSGGTPMKSGTQTYHLQNISLGSSSSSSSSDDEPVGFNCSFNVGLYTPISYKIAIKTQYSLQLLGIGDSTYWYDRFSVGLAFYLIDGMSKEEFWGL